MANLGGGTLSARPLTSHYNYFCRRVMNATLSVVEAENVPGQKTCLLLFGCEIVDFEDQSDYILSRYKCCLISFGHFNK